MLPENIQKNIYRSTSSKFAGIIGFAIVLGCVTGALLLIFMIMIEPSICNKESNSTGLSLFIPLVVAAVDVFMLYLLTTWLKKTFVLALRQKDEELKKHAYEPSSDKPWHSEEAEDNDKGQ